MCERATWEGNANAFSFWSTQLLYHCQQKLLHVAHLTSVDQDLPPQNLQLDDTVQEIVMAIAEGSRKWINITIDDLALEQDER